MSFSRSFSVSLIIGLTALFFIPKTEAATLNLSPTSGSFSVDSTFDVNLFLNTEGQSINLIQAALSFPADKLQLVTPSTGRSIISVWTAPPTFNNQTGKINLQGGIPGGVKVSNGLFTTLTFRVKGVGNAIVKFLDDTKILLNDGLGTDALNNTQGAIYKLVLPPPLGPLVVSETHSDQSRWYSNSTAILKWESDLAVEGYSYMLSDEPVALPDNTSEGLRNEIAYKNLGDGVHYFHIKALRDGAWGGVTNFALNIDTAPPAEFPIKISPSPRTTSKQPIVNFETTDSFSGLDFYEYKVISLKPVSAAEVQPETSFFIEAAGPQVLNLNLGSYDVVVRAHDKAGNFREITQRLEIVKPIFQVITGQGLKIGDVLTLSWLWVWGIALLILALLALGAWKISNWHRDIILKRVQGELPEHVNSQLQELKKYRQKYGKIAVLFLAVFTSFLISNSARAQQKLELSPPLVSTISKNISNDEIFYIGGKTDIANAKVIIYLQNLQSGETLSESVDADKKGEWFYRHPTFLSTGNYLLWTQTKLGEEVSPPSPQIQMSVRSTAIQFGASRLSLETLYLIISITLLLIILGLVAFILFHFYGWRKKAKIFQKEIKEAEESVRRGFAVLRRDIEAELAVVHKAKLSHNLSVEEKTKEETLLKDLKRIEQYIGKEIWDVEKLGSPS